LAGLQALRDPYTGILETEPIKETHILENFYKDSWKKVNIKNGRYLPEETSRNYSWEHPQPSYKGPLPDPFKFKSQITKDEAEGKQTRNWLHNSILDKSAFTECNRSLTNSKSPGSDGIVNELLKMLPAEFQDTIHMLLIIMWATGFTSKAWKTSNTIHIDKNKGYETSISSYRPIGLANTLYKLWTRMITNTLYEYAEAYGNTVKKCKPFLL